ncbi:MAG: anaerobic sulfatase maturase [Planctomycetes bacterium]|nr:anaerobic sulfatase maturase [Planctomycetota bacterium]
MMTLDVFARRPAGGAEASEGVGVVAEAGTEGRNRSTRRERRGRRPHLKPFSLLVKPVSANCNLRCKYCFYRRVGRMYRGRRRMSSKVLDAMVKQLVGLGFSPAAFSWQGGEPTLAGLDFYRQAVACQARFGSPGQVISNSLQTNGLLIDEEWGEFFAQYRFLIGLSLDGPQELHDAYRKRGDGRGSFSDALRAVAVLRRHKVEFNLLSVLTPLTVGRARELYHFFVEGGLNYLQFIPCVERGPQGGAAPFTVDADGYGRFLCDLFDVWLADGRRASIRLFDAILERLVTGESPLCVLGRRCDHYLVVEHSGDVYPCDFFVVRRWHLGNLLKTPLAKLFGGEKHEQFASMKTQLAPRCRDCEWVEMCWGGCPKDRQFVGDPRRVPTYLCPAYQMLFAHAGGEFRRLAAELAGRVGGPPAKGVKETSPPAQ